MFSSTYSPKGVFTKGFSWVLHAFLQGAGQPLADVLPEEKIQAAFDAEGADFGRGEGDVYTPALTLWAFLSQVMHAGRLRSCAAAVSRVIVLCTVLGRKVPSPDTGAYCRARAKLPEPVLRRLVYTIGDDLEPRVPEGWLWLGRHVKIADGTTLTVPDTAENQTAWPQPRTQKPGVGFPILRMLVLLSLATAALSGLEIGPYLGKETGEPALFRQLLDRFQPGDVFLGDCCFSSYFLIALLLAQGVDVVARQHQCRKTDFRRGQKLGKEDHVVVWRRPARPEWMDEETYALIPETLTVRELRVRVDVRGFRVKDLVVVTTLTDAERYPREEIARLFRLRWHVELDLRNIKISLQMDDVRGRSPEMVRREIWAHWLTYNLTRKVMAEAALEHGRLPRRLSFAAALQAIAASWDHATVADEKRLALLAAQQCRFLVRFEVGDRPDRVEPRAVKKRPKPHRLLKEPRKVARARLLGARTAA
jgi:putative transposase